MRRDAIDISFQEHSTTLLFDSIKLNITLQHCVVRFNLNALSSQRVILIIRMSIIAMSSSFAQLSPCLHVATLMEQRQTISKTCLSSNLNNLIQCAYLIFRLVGKILAAQEIAQESKCVSSRIRCVWLPGLPGLGKGQRQLLCWSHTLRPLQLAPQREQSAAGLLL